MNLKTIAGKKKTFFVAFNVVLQKKKKRIPSFPSSPRL